MIQILVVLAFAASAVSANDPWTRGLCHRFDVMLFKNDAFEYLPWSKAEAAAKGYILVEVPARSAGYSTVSLWVLKTKPCVGLLFDDTEKIAGVQIAIAIDNVKGEPLFAMEKQGFKKVSYVIDGKSTEYWTIAIYFKPENYTSEQDIGGDELFTGHYLTVENNDGGLDKIPTNLDNLHDIWKMQACMPFMGTHYYHNMTTSTTCDKPFHPIFLLFDTKTNQLMGVGMMVFVKLYDASCHETPNKPAVQAIVKEGPQCLYDAVEKYGVVTHHIYFVNKPRTIVCW